MTSTWCYVYRRIRFADSLSLQPVSQLLETLPPETTVHQVVERARCSRCKRKGFITMRLSTWGLVMWP